ncbi:MAG: response regulator transcription factor [Parabacteroides sp.]|nr:response regulator transcription factor [Parabacteroides sp.]
MRKLLVKTFYLKICLIDYEPNNPESQHLAIQIKSAGKELPVIFLCDSPTREDINYIFSLHTDDLLRKPLDLDILYAHIKSILNRYLPIKETDVKTYLFGKFRFDVQKQTLTIEDKSMKLTTKEVDLLALFCKNSNKLIDRTLTLHLIWKNDSYFSARSMDVYITKLRKLLKHDPSIKIINVHGKGYKFVTQPKKDEH